MISIILTSGKDLQKIMNSLDSDEYEFLVAGVAQKDVKKTNVRFIKDSNLATTLIKCFRESSGDYIAVFDSYVRNIGKCIEKMKERIESGADIVVGRRDRKSKMAKMLVNLLFPKSRIVDDPLSEIFMLKRKVIEKVNLHPIGSKILLEILAKGNYERVEEVSVKLKDKNNKTKESYAKYSRHLLKVAWEEGEIARFFKFGAVSGSGVILNEFLLWLLLAFEFPLITAGILSVEFSILWTFVLNDLWTFKDRGRKGMTNYLKRMTKFNFACLLGLILNVLVLFILSEFTGMHPLKANIAGMAVAFIWNFLAHNLWTWYE